MPRKSKSDKSLLRRIIKWPLYAIASVFVLLILICSAIYLIAGTDEGLKQVTAFANKRIAGLNINGAQGNLRSGVQFSQIQFNNDSIAILAESVSSQWNSGCLKQKRFCLENLDIDSLDITIPDSTDTSATDSRTQNIELPEISLPVDILIDDIDIGTVNIKPSSNAVTQTIKNVHLSASSREHTVSIRDLSLEYNEITSRLAGDIELKDDYRLNLSHSLVFKDVLPDHLPEGDADQSLTLYTRLSGSLGNLDISSNTSGIVDINVRASVQPLHPDIPMSLTLTNADLGWPIESRSLVLVEKTSIEASGDKHDITFNLNTNLSGEQIPESQVSLTGIVNQQRISLAQIMIDTLGGAAKGVANASFAAPLQWNTQWTMQDINPSIQIPDLDGLLNASMKLDGVLDAGRWSVNAEELSVNGTLRDLPFVLEAKAAKALNDIWLIEKINLNNYRNEIKIDGIMGEEFDIDARFTLPQLENFLPGFTGGFDADIRLNGPVSSPDIFIEADAEQLIFNDVLIQALKLNGDINELFIADSQLNASVAKVQAGEMLISDSILGITGTRAGHQLSFNANGAQQSSLELTLVGELMDTFNWNAILTNANIDVPEHAITLQDDVNINWRQDNQSINVSTHCWTIENESNLCLLDEFHSGNSGQSRITLDQYSLENLDGLLPENDKLTGNLSISTELAWGGSDPDNKRAILDATIDNATIQTLDGLGDPVSLAYERIDASATLQSDNADIQLALRSENLGNADVLLSVNPSDPERLLNGSLQLQGLKLDIAQPFLPDVDQISGSISAEGNLTGTLDKPQYNGTVMLDDPVFQSELIPLPITGGQLTMRTTGNNVALDGQLNSDEGTIVVDGKGNLDPKNWSASAILTGKNLNIVTDPVEESTVNHRIRIDANSRRVSVGGVIDIPQAVINVESLPQGAATVSSDVIIVEDIVEENEDSGLPDTGLDLAVNLDVSLGEDVTVSAYGLDANLAGDMDIRLRGDRPLQLGGEIRVVDGVFKKYGQDLEANGQITFVGPVDSTRLAIDAVREIDDEDRTAGLRIQGTVARPEITLFTDPADKSQDAILSYVVLGRDINEASDQDADLLATAALALAIRGGSAVGGGIAQALGVREFGLETQGSGDNTELIVSGRLNDRILLSYGRGVFDAQNTLYLRYDLTKQLYLEAATSTIDNALDVFYSFSF